MDIPAWRNLPFQVDSRNRTTRHLNSLLPIFSSQDTPLWGSRQSHLYLTPPYPFPRPFVSASTFLEPPYPVYESMYESMYEPMASLPTLSSSRNHDFDDPDMYSAPEDLLFLNHRQINVPDIDFESISNSILIRILGELPGNAVTENLTAGLTAGLTADLLLEHELETILEQVPFLFEEIGTAASREDDSPSPISESDLARLAPAQTLQHDIPDKTCSICFQTFCSGDTVRILGCQHHFHSACVDPWLLQKNKTCPNCRHTVA
jgi:hypothetical protein